MLLQFISPQYCTECTFSHRKGGVGGRGILERRGYLNVLLFLFRSTSTKGNFLSRFIIIGCHNLVSSFKFLVRSQDIQVNLQYILISLFYVTKQNLKGTKSWLSDATCLNQPTGIGGFVSIF